MIEKVTSPSAPWSESVAVNLAISSPTGLTSLIFRSSLRGRETKRKRERGRKRARGREKERKKEKERERDREREGGKKKEGGRKKEREREREREEKNINALRHQSIIMGATGCIVSNQMTAVLEVQTSLG